MSIVAKCDICGATSDVSIDFGMEEIYIGVGWKTNRDGDDFCPLHDMRVDAGSMGWFDIDAEEGVRVFVEVMGYDPATRVYRVTDHAPDDGGDARDYLLPASVVESSESRMSWTLREEGGEDEHPF